MSELVTQAEFARLRYVSKKTVTIWKSRGLLVLVGAKIHREATDKILDARPAKYRGGSTSAKIDETPEKLAAPLPGDFEHWSHAEATRRKEVTLALTRQLQYDVARGKLMPVEQIQPVWASIVIATRNAMLSIPGRARMALQLTGGQTEALDKIIKETLRAVAMTEVPPELEQQ
jgi:hypothetical protein